MLGMNTKKENKHENAESNTLLISDAELSSGNPNQGYFGNDIPKGVFQEYFQKSLRKIYWT